MKPLAFFLPILLSALLPAQESQTSITFRMVAWESGNPPALAYVSGGEVITIPSLDSTRRSHFLTYKGSGNLNFYDPTTIPAGEKEREKIKPLASVNIPNGFKYPLILLLPNPDGNPPFRHVVFDDDPSGFPFGTYLFQNFSKHKVAADMGGERFVVEPDRSQHLVSSDEKALHLRLAVSEETGKGWKMIFDSFYPNWEDRRTLIFVFEGNKNGRPRMEVRTLLENEAVWNAAFQKEKDE